MQKGDVVSGRFEVEHLTGSGGMGQVYRARDLETGETVALKVLHQMGVPEIERFAREADLLATLRHPGIVRYVGGGSTAGGAPYLAMEWLQGEPLSERLKRTQLTVAESVTLGLRVASALAAVHERLIVHRDLKPSNIFLRGGSISDVTLIDFGIAFRADVSRQLTVSGAMLGTPGYIAPEQAHAANVDARADVFSLGCVLFRCLSGRAPFHGNDALSILLKIAADEPPRLRELRPSVPADLDELVARMLSKSREDRPANGSAVASALQAIEDLAPFSSTIVPITPRNATELTGVERRVVSLVLARRPGNAADATLLVADSGGRERAVRALADRHRGKLEILADGSLLVLLVSADAATDLVARAARCALALRSLLEGAPTVVVSGRDMLGPRLPTGELIDRAVALLGTASAGEPIRVDEMTAGLLGPGFDVEHLSKDARPRSPSQRPRAPSEPPPAPAGAEAFYLRGERSEPDGRRLLLGKPTACLGRERELLQLEALFDQCVDERMATAVVITAPAGVGKSRLVHELVRKLEARGEPLEVWVGRGDSMSAGSAFGMLSKAIRAAAGIRDGEPIEERRKKLKERVGRHLKADLDRTAALLGELIGTSFFDDEPHRPSTPPEGHGEAGESGAAPLPSVLEADLERAASHAPGALAALRQDPVMLGEQMRRAFVAFLRAECAAGPVVLVLEDLQWGDLPTVRFVGAALDELRERPLMVVAVGRTEVHALFPRLWTARGAQEIRLRELSRRASERLVRQVLGDEVGERTLDEIVTRADGHAFYLEELIRAVAAGKGTALPETVLAMVQARLERLDPEARRVLRAASVFGETFWQRGVERLLGTSGSGAWLTELCDHEVIAARENSRFPGEAEYRFRHALVREAAYGMLTEADRVLAHRIAAEWLEQVGEADAMVLAEHFERGEAAYRAIVWFHRAAEQALEGGDLDAVLSRATRALACGATGELAGELLRMQGYVHEWRIEYPEAAHCYAEARAALPRTSAVWYQAIGGALHTSASLGDFVRMRETIEALREGLAEDPSPISPVHGMSGAVPVLCVAGEYALARDFIRRFSMDEHGEGAGAGSAEALERAAGDIARCHYAFFAEGDPWALRQHALAALARGEGSDEPRVVHLARAYEGIALVKLGVAEPGMRMLREAREAAAARGFRLVEHFVDLFLVDALANRAQIEEAEALLHASRSQAIESALWGAVWSISAARIARRRRDFDGAVDELVRGLSVIDLLAPGYAAHATGLLARCELERGTDHGRVIALVKLALAMLDEIGTWSYDVGIRTYSAGVLHDAGDHAAARATLAVALAQIHARAARIDDPAMRESYLTEVPENAHALAFARAWGVPGG